MLLGTFLPEAVGNNNQWARTIDPIDIQALIAILS
jgi:hypothetical protein